MLPDLRRLHLCAQTGEKLLFVFRGVESRNQSSPARVRLLVQAGAQLQVQVLKRRGPPLLLPLQLSTHPHKLSALLAARKSRRSGIVLPIGITGSHVLDRTASFAE